MSYLAKYGRSRSNGNYGDMSKNDSSRLAFQGHSIEVIETDADRSATYDFLLVIHSNHGAISYRFRDKRRFRSQIAVFSPCISAKGEGSHRSFVTAVGLNKLE